MKRILLNFLKYSIAIGAVAYLLSTGSLFWSDLRIRPNGVPLVVVAVLLTLLAVLLGFYRFWVLLSGIGVPIRLGEAMRVGFIGAFFNTFLLGGIGGDVVRIAYVSRLARSKSTAIASIVMDRVIGLMGLLCLSGLSIALVWRDIGIDPNFQNLALMILGSFFAVGLAVVVSIVALAKGRVRAIKVWLACASSITILLVLGDRSSELSHPAPAALARARFFDTMSWVASGIVLIAFLCIVILPSFLPGRRLHNVLHKERFVGHRILTCLNAVLAYRNAFGVVSLAFVLSFVLQGLGVLSVYVLGSALALSPHPALGPVFLAAPPALVANALPVPGGGIGIGEAVFDQLLGLSQRVDGRPIHGGAAIFLMLRVITIVIGLGGLPIYLMCRQNCDTGSAGISIAVRSEWDEAANPPATERARENLRKAS